MNIVANMLRRPAYLRPPYWRWQIAMEHIRHPELPESDLARDRHALALTRYYRALAEFEGKPEIAAMQYPAIAEAHELHTRTNPSGGLRWQVESLLMAQDGTDAQIAKIVPLIHGVATVHMYRVLFFDVRDYLDKQAAVLDNILAPCQARGSSTQDADYTWKLFAYHWGFDETVQMHQSKCGMPMKASHRDWFKQLARDKVMQIGLQAVNSVGGLRQDEALELIPHFNQSWFAEDKQPAGGVDRNNMAEQLRAMFEIVTTTPEHQAKILSNTSAREDRSKFAYPALDTKASPKLEKVS